MEAPGARGRKDTLRARRPDRRNWRRIGAMMTGDGRRPLALPGTAAESPAGCPPQDTGRKYRRPPPFRREAPYTGERDPNEPPSPMNELGQGSRYGAV
jgi:hypothetical protein